MPFMLQKIEAAKVGKLIGFLIVAHCRFINDLAENTNKDKQQTMLMF